MLLVEKDSRCSLAERVDRPPRRGVVDCLTPSDVSHRLWRCESRRLCRSPKFSSRRTHHGGAETRRRSRGRGEWQLAVSGLLRDSVVQQLFVGSTDSVGLLMEGAFLKPPAMPEEFHSDSVNLACITSETER